MTKSTEKNKQVKITREMLGEKLLRSVQEMKATHERKERNGVPLLPANTNSIPITPALINQLNHTLP